MIFGSGRMFSYVQVDPFYDPADFNHYFLRLKFVRRSEGKAIHIYNGNGCSIPHIKNDANHRQDDQE